MYCFPDFRFSLRALLVFMTWAGLTIQIASWNLMLAAILTVPVVGASLSYHLTDSKLAILPGIAAGFLMLLCAMTVLFVAVIGVEAIGSTFEGVWFLIILPINLVASVLAGIIGANVYNH